MDLLDRYVAAVRRNLPAAKAEDIAAELRDVLLERAEVREAALDRPLDKSEWEALLVEFGHPLVVAARYRDKQSLIGPESYPFYLYSLTLFGAITLLGVAVMTVVRIVVNSGDPGQIVLHLLYSLWWAGTTVVAPRRSSSRWSSAMAASSAISVTGGRATCPRSRSRWAS